MTLPDDGQLRNKTSLRLAPSIDMNSTFVNPDSEDVELRCPNNPSRLFAILIENGSAPKVTSGNLFEVACPDCARIRRRAGRPVYRVLHRYYISGEFVETVEVLREQP